MNRYIATAEVDPSRLAEQIEASVQANLIDACLVLAKCGVVTSAVKAVEMIDREAKAGTITVYAGLHPVYAVRIDLSGEEIASIRGRWCQEALRAAGLHALADDAQRVDGEAS